MITQIDLPPWCEASWTLWELQVYTGLSVRPVAARLFYVPNTYGAGALFQHLPGNIECTSIDFLRNGFLFVAEQNRKSPTGPRADPIRSIKSSIVVERFLRPRKRPLWGTAVPHLWMLMSESVLCFTRLKSIFTLWLEPQETFSFLIRV